MLKCSQKKIYLGQILPTGDNKVKIGEATRKCLDTRNIDMILTIGGKKVKISGASRYCIDTEAVQSVNK